MFRILIALLAALDAVAAAALGLAIALVPLTLLWLVGIGAPDWGALWPAAGMLFQLVHLVPLAVRLPADYLGLAGIDAAGAAFAVSLPPLLLTLVTAALAYRSGTRAARAGGWVTGVAAFTLVFAAAGLLVGLAANGPVVAVAPWQAVLLPAAVAFVPGVLGAVVGAWREGDEGLVDLVRGRIEALRPPWRAVPGAALRGLGGTLAGLAATAALVLVAGLVLRGGTIIALYQSANVDLWGAVALALAQLGYLPDLLVWALAFAAGPGLALGVDSAVSPAGTQLGIVPGIPILGVLPESTTPWLLALVLLPIAAGFVGGGIARRTLHDEGDAVRPRIATAVLVAAASAGVAAVLALLASGSLGPDRLAEVGPPVGPLALAVGLETLLGAGIALLSRVRDAGSSDLPAAPALPRAAEAPAAPGLRPAPTAPPPPPDLPSSPRA